jgi:hypothetical protein
MTAIGTVLIVLSATSVLIFGVAATALARVKDLGAAIVAVMLTAGAQIVVIAEVLSLFDAWQWAPALALQAITAVLAVVAARRWGDLTGPVAAMRAWWTTARVLRPRELKRHPLTNVVVAFVGLMLLIEFVLAIGVAPNTWDSMTYHLTRAAYWIQNGSIAQFTGATDRQAIFPVNGEILQGWVMMFSRGDRLVQLVQWLAQLGIIAFVFAACRDLKFSKREAVWASCALVSMPVFVAQASSSQNDLILTFFAASTLLFAMRAIKGDAGAAVLAAIGAGLMVGTKTNGILFTAAIALALLVANGRQWRVLIRPVIYAAIGIALLGFFNYGQNMVHRGGPLAASQFKSLSVQSPREWPVNTVHVSWTTAMNFPGISLGAFATVAERASNKLLEVPAAKLSGVKPTPLASNSQLLEDQVGLGLPLLLLLLPSLAIAFIRWRERDRLAYACASVLGFLFVCLTLRDNVWIGRFAAAPAALGAPLMAVIARREAIRMFALIVIALSMFTMTLRGTNKPIGAGFWAHSPRSTRTANLTLIKQNEAAPIERFNALVPKNARVGFIGTENSWEYPYFGPNLTRKLIKLKPYDVKPGVFKKYGLDAIFMVTPSATSIPPVGFKPAYRDSSDLFMESHFIFLAPRQSATN